MLYAFRNAIADLFKFIGWRLIRRADKLDDPPKKGDRR
jgi:hypothetical protein